MPVAPRKICKHPNCGQLTTGTYCEKHENKKQETVKAERIKYDKVRGTASSRGYTYRWSKAAKLYRDEHPLCEICLEKGILELSECVDHKIPVSGPNDPLFWDEKNWQALSNNCHSIKTAKEDGGLGNKKIERTFDGRIG